MRSLPSLLILLLGSTQLANAGRVAGQNTVGNTASDAEIRTLLRKAHTTAMQEIDPLNRFNLLCEIASYQQQVGDKETAKSTLKDARDGLEAIRALQKPDDRAFAMVTLAQVQGSVFSFETERQTLQELKKNSMYAGWLYTRIIPYLLRRKQYDSAALLVDQGNDPGLQAICLVEVAGAYLLNGNTERASQIFQRVKTMSKTFKPIDAVSLMVTMGEIQAYFGSLSEAEKIATAVDAGEYRDQVLLAISLVEARRAKVSEACSTVKKMKNVATQQKSLAYIVTIRAGAKDVAWAGEVAKTITEASESVNAYSSLAVALHHLGQEEAASEALKTALGVEVKIHAPVKQAQALEKISITQFQLGDPTAADTLAHASRVLVGQKDKPGEYDVEREREEIWVTSAKIGRSSDALKEIAQTSRTDNFAAIIHHIAYIQASQGDYSGAQETVSKIHEDMVRLDMIKEICRLQSNGGESGSALAWTLSLSSPYSRVGGFLGIAGGMMDRLHPGKRISPQSVTEEDELQGSDYVMDSGLSFFLQDMGIQWQDLLKAQGAR